MNVSDFKRSNQHFALIDELDTSVKLIKLGLGELQNLDESNSFYFLPFQLLSQGFERLMKSYICLGYLDKNNNYPQLAYIKNELGHDLEKLIKTILEKYFKTYNRLVLIDDKTFLESDKELAELLGVLSDFGKLARYHNYDVITGKENNEISPQGRWGKFEMKFISFQPGMYEKLFNNETKMEVYGAVSRHIIILFEKFVSALGRQFIFGTLGEKGKQFSGEMFDFGMLYPKDFGNTDYRKNTTRYKIQPRSVHKRTWMDFLHRQYNPNYKSKKLNKNEYAGEWPFLVDTVIIECRYKYWCVVTINGKDYALNGSAKGRYKLEDPYEAGMATIGKSISEIIQLALHLK